jgi:uncharacterized protein YndB with AHSA1/START domain
MSALDLRESVTIHAPIEEVWDAVTTPESIKRWFFGVDTESDWKVGSPLVHRGEYQGEPYEDKGEILRFEPPQLLVHTHWSDVSGTPDSPEHYQEVAWRLSGSNGTTELTVTERNLPSAEGKETSEQGWRAALGSLKDLLEREES